MTFNEKVVHRLLISLVFTAINWVLIDWLIVEIPFWRYLIVEVFLVVSLKFYTFTIRKLNL